MTPSIMNATIFLNIALANGLLIAGASLPEAIHNPPVIINETISMAKGAYVRTGDLGHLEVGDIVAMPMNASAKAYLGDKLGYPESTMLIKRVAGLSGDTICRERATVTIRGSLVQASLGDERGNNLPSWSGCRTLLAGEFFLLGDHAGSFDSRYFGAVTRQELSGTYKAVMTW
jgi:signal peptidase I